MSATKCVPRNGASRMRPDSGSGLENKLSYGENGGRCRQLHFAMNMSLLVQMACSRPEDKVRQKRVRDQICSSESG